MLKKYLALLTVIVCSSLIPGLTLASPLMDYSTGKTAVNITSYPNLHMKDHFVNQSNSHNNTIKTDGKNSNLDWDITTGMGGKWALQYRQFNPEGDNNYGEIFGMKTQEVNVLYKLDTNLSVFVGWQKQSFFMNIRTVLFQPKTRMYYNAV